MSWWNAKYKNDHGEYEITFGSKKREKAKAVEKVCQAVIDKQVEFPHDVVLKEDVEKILEWLLLYVMTDDKQVYSNGTVFVPLYRVKQALEDKAYNGFREGC